MVSKTKPNEAKTPDALVFCQEALLLLRAQSGLVGLDVFGADSHAYESG
jgi:hypothetical protein